MSELIYLSNVRLSFPHLIEPQKTMDATTGKERISYNADFILAQDNPAFKQFMTAVGSLAVAEWKENANQVLEMIHRDRKSRCFGTQVDKINKATFQPYDGYIDMVYITARSSRGAPQMIQSDGTAIDSSNTMAYQQLARKMYGGCRVNAAVKPWIQNNSHGRGIRCDLVAIQFAGDDVAFGDAVPDTSSMFGAVQSQASQAPAAGGMPLPPFMMGLNK